MLVDLVRIGTRDGFQLDGALERPGPNVAPALGLDAACLIHGTGSNFYSSTFLELLSQQLVKGGCAALRINTRGHDGISTAVTAKGGIRHGAAYEVVDDCRHDLAAIVQFLKDKVGPRVGLLGHSLGAVKCLYAAAHEKELAPARIMALSPPRLSHEWFCSSEKKGEFLETYRKAETLLSQGFPNALLEVAMPLPFIISAAGYLEKYGPDERYNFLKCVPALQCPTLMLFGSIEVANNVAFRGLPEAIGALPAKRAQVTTRLVEGADHFYSGVRPAAWAAIEEWLKAIQDTPSPLDRPSP